jgi:hypothetical protein
MFLLFIVLIGGFACGAEPGYLVIRFQPGGGKDEAVGVERDRSFHPQAVSSDTTIHLRWEGPSSGSLSVPYASRRAEIKELEPGSYTLEVTAVSGTSTIFATTIRTDVVAGKTTVVSIPLGGTP